MTNNYYIVAINLVVDGKLINTNNVPILCYCQAEDEIEDIIKSDSSFKLLIVKNCIETFLLDKSFIYCSFYKEVEGEDKYFTKTISVKDIFEIDYEEYIRGLNVIKVYNIFKDLYYKAFKETYTETKGKVSEAEIILSIKDIYIKIKDKYTDRLSVDTVINYVRKELRENTDINEDRINSMVSYIKNILINLD